MQSKIEIHKLVKIVATGEYGKVIGRAGMEFKYPDFGYYTILVNGKEKGFWRDDIEEVE